ncbi:MAG: biopolymer transporter ExbD [Verrucomicrobia bacterium]|nr:biopolymer transporter ExbD [Verrucomicrobiota bacterium]
MRRFSQRHSLVTLSDINITPLLDLAFVLLIIFIIISPSIKSAHEHGMDLKLPQGGGPTSKVDPKNVRVVEVSSKGTYMLGGQQMPIDRIEKDLVRDFRSNPNLIVRIRLDQLGFNKDTLEIMDRCQRNGITTFSFDTEPRKAR